MLELKKSGRLLRDGHALKQLAGATYLNLDRYRTEQLLQRHSKSHILGNVCQLRDSQDRSGYQTHYTLSMP